MKLTQLIFVSFLIIGLAINLEVQPMDINPCDSTELLMLIKEFEATHKAILAKQISNCYKENKQYENALNWHKKAMEHTSEKVAIDYFELARLYSLTNRKTEARESAVDVLSIEKSYQSEVYTLIGDLYLTSYDECKNDDLLKSRAVFIAAYEMYKMANNEKKMEIAENQFPSEESVLHIPQGTLVKVDCWIEEEVELKFRREK